jgi:hypothetical protein
VCREGFEQIVIFFHTCLYVLAFCAGFGVLQINPRILRAALVDLNSIEFQILCDVLLELALILDYTRTTSETPAMQVRVIPEAQK